MEDKALPDTVDQASEEPLISDPDEASGGARPKRRTALGSKALWRSKIAAGEL